MAFPMTIIHLKGGQWFLKGMRAWVFQSTSKCVKFQYPMTERLPTSRAWGGGVAGTSFDQVSVKEQMPLMEAALAEPRSARKAIQPVFLEDPKHPTGPQHGIRLMRSTLQWVLSIISLAVELLKGSY